MEQIGTVFRQLRESRNISLRQATGGQFSPSMLSRFETGLCKIVMTFTDTACDCAESLPIEIVAGLKQIEGIEDVKVEVTWSPAWKITRISRYGRIALGLPPR